MLGLTLAEPRFRPPSPPPTSPPRRATSPLRSWLSSWRWTYTLLVLLIWCSTATANVGSLVYAHTAAANVGNQRPTYAYTAARDGKLTEVEPVAHPPSKGCDGALNNWCTRFCALCPRHKKYARFDKAAHEPHVDRWRCYCEYTLVDNLKRWANRDPRVSGVPDPDPADKSWTHYCSRHIQLERLLDKCTRGEITPEGQEVREL